MNIPQIVSLNTKKLKKHKVKALYFILPLTLMVIVTTVISSQLTNVNSALDKVVFETIAEQSKLIKLTKDFGMRTGGGAGGMVSFNINSSDNQYSETDLEAIKSIENVEDAAINSSVPVSNTKATTLFDDKEFNIPSLYGLEENMAALFTEEDFSYSEGEPIPIILNANSFVEQYEDWGGKDEIKVDVPQPGQGGGGVRLDFQNSNPIKNKAIDYDKSELLGKEFEMEVGGLDSIQTYSNDFSETGLTFKKLTEAELNEKVEERKTAISKYWDYDKFNTPLKYTFKVVGIIEDEGSFESYIPEDFANKLMKDYVQNQLDARNSTEILIDELGSIYNGINFDGVEIQSSALTMGIARPIRIGFGPGGAASDEEETAQYNIPGLVLKTERSGSANRSLFGPSTEVEGLYTESDVYEKSAKSGTTLIVKVNNFYNRENVVTALNDNGYAYQDLYKSDVFTGLQNNIGAVRKGLIVFFITFNVILVILTMSKFVTESRKEIGILRAMGAKKSDIRNMFLSQATLYSLVSLILGVIVGSGLTLLIAGLVQTWFDNEIGEAVKESFNIVSKADSSTFFQIDILSIGIFAGILILVTLLVSYLPARKAASLKPVEAIRKD